MKVLFLGVLLFCVVEVNGGCDQLKDCSQCISAKCLFIHTRQGDECVKTTTGKSVLVVVRRLSQCKIVTAKKQQFEENIRKQGVISHVPQNSSVLQDTPEDHVRGKPNNLVVDGTSSLDIVTPQLITTQKTSTTNTPITSSSTLLTTPLSTTLGTSTSILRTITSQTTSKMTNPPTTVSTITTPFTYLPPPPTTAFPLVPFLTTSVKIFPKSLASAYQFPVVATVHIVDVPLIPLESTFSTSLASVPVFLTSTSESPTVTETTLTTIPTHAEGYLPFSSISTNPSSTTSLPTTNKAILSSTTKDIPIHTVALVNNSLTPSSTTPLPTTTSGFSTMSTKDIPLRTVTLVTNSLTPSSTSPSASSDDPLDSKSHEKIEEENYIKETLIDMCRLSIHTNEARRQHRHKIISPPRIIERRIRRCVRLFSKAYKKA